MNEDDSRDESGKKPAQEPPPERTADSTPGDRREDPLFGDFDEDYEESERDTDYASAFEEEESEGEDPLESLEEDDDTDHSAAWRVLGGVPPGSRRLADASEDPWSAEDSADTDSDVVDEGTETAALELFEDEVEEPAEDDSEEDWGDEEEYPEEPDEFENEPGDTANRWPLGLITVGLVALVLLAAGGYGVIQQRSQSEEENRRLQAALATAASPADVAATRGALREMELQNEKHLASIEVLTLYNKRLEDTVAGLEKQLAAQEALTPGKSEPAKAVTKPAAKPAAKTVAAEVVPGKAGAAADSEAAAVAEGDWFVNFSSYSQRDAAEKWAKKLDPLAGKAVVAPTTKDGKTFYRVRIVGLANRAQADKVAGQLQSAHKLPPLWVGRE